MVPSRVRASVGGTAIAESTQAGRVDVLDEAPVLWFPRSHVTVDGLDHLDDSAWRSGAGDVEASYWTATVGDVVVEDVAWSYEDALPESAPIQGHLSFSPDLAGLRAELPPAAELPEDV